MPAARVTIVVQDHFPGPLFLVPLLLPSQCTADVVTLYLPQSLRFPAEQPMLLFLPPAFAVFSHHALPVRHEPFLLRHPAWLLPPDVFALPQPRGLNLQPSLHLPPPLFVPRQYRALF